MGSWNATLMVPLRRLAAQWRRIQSITVNQRVSGQERRERLLKMCTRNCEQDSNSKQKARSTLGRTSRKLHAKEFESRDVIGRKNVKVADASTPGKGQGEKTYTNDQGKELPV
jgi:hypothetical protein